MNNAILIFDSGVGGLSILSEVRQRFPQTLMHYLMDSEWFPYGIRDDEVLAERIVSICHAAVNRLQPALLILACNTASTLALAQLRDILQIPVVGVVPAIKVAAERCATHRNPEIGLLATPATVRRPYTHKLIADFAPHCEVHCLGSSRLVELSEAFLAGQDVRDDVSNELCHWLSEHPQMQQVVLGCTHFPLLTVLLTDLWPAINWIDSGKAVAQQAERVFPADRHCGDGSSSLWWTGTETFIPSGAIEYLRHLGPLSSAMHWQAE